MTKRADKFGGFAPGKFNMTQIPSPFFSDLLPLIDDLAELKVMLFCFWALPQREGDYPYLLREGFLSDTEFLQGLAVVDPLDKPENILDKALQSAVRREGLLCADVEIENKIEQLYFVNTERGRAAIEQIKSGNWRPDVQRHRIEILPQRPNIYRLYEENIGALTPLIADTLKDMEKDYSAEWVEEAIRISVEQNKHSIRYIHAILNRWRREGKAKSRDHNHEQDGKRFVTGKYADFFEH